ncbi:DUF6615 family protein [Vibrio campbellii]|uniref:DUF6615 family protein n=1 Tax=Vibrio campbellii TaxID=680 RepID=UPI0003AAD957|nr:DUF6615 family protein [Vibrio campbellii]
MKLINVCKQNICLNKRVGEFIRNVRSVGEESISDYLAWQWHKVDPFMRHYRVSQSNRIQEHYVTGADFKIELWNITQSGGVALSIQAKKCIDLYDSYRKAFRYGDPDKHQIDLLINNAVHSKPKMQPCYVIYTNPESGECTKDGNHQIQNYGAFIASAYDIEKFADLPPKTKISRKDILKVSYPLHYIFCFSERQPSNDVILPFFEEKIAMKDFPPYVKAAISHENRSYIEECMKESGFKSNDILLIRSVG